MVSFTKEASPATEDEVLRFESAIGQRLPPEYRKFLRRTNGGVPAPSFFNDPVIGVRFVNQVLLFYPLAIGHSQGLEEKYAENREVLPEGLLPIGKDIGAEPICLCLDKSGEFGCIYGVDGAVEDTREPVAVRRLSGSFDEFLNSLFQTEEDRLAEEQRTQDRVMSLAKTGKPEDLDVFLAQGNTLNEMSSQGLTLMQCAARVGNLQLVKASLERGANPSCAIHQAFLHRHWELARYLADARVDLNECDQREKRPMELIFGIFGAEREKLEAFLKSRGARRD